MASKEYEQESKNLLKAIDLAIETVMEIPPKNFNQVHVQTFIDSYYIYKKQILEADSKFQTMASLKYDIANVFTYFNEGSGPAVELFWNKIREHSLPYKRENKLKKILSKKKIKNQVEYDYVIDTITPFMQEGVISESDFQILNELIEKFESKKKI